MMCETMALKKEYNKSILLRCMTCGADYAFERDDQNGCITCMKCNRVYHGGEDELRDLNETLIADELELLKEEVTKDIQKEFNNLFKKLKF